ncbi:MAG TPA: hypothetical protein VHL78_05825 [Actinomycetota bacterium]|nr:hypothetical protein [Actinomycetota bacterium]
MLHRAADGDMIARRGSGGASGGRVGQNPAVLLVAVIALVLAVGCGGSEPAPPPERVTGLITEIARDAGGTIESFVVRQGARSFDVRIDPARDYGFDLEHLEEHRTQELPVLVRLRERDGALYAVEILDA